MISLKTNSRLPVLKTTNDVEKDTKQINNYINQVKNEVNKLEKQVTTTTDYLNTNISLPQVKRYLFEISNVINEHFTVSGGVLGSTAIFGGVSGTSQFEADGTLKFNDGATVWDDINLSVQSLTTLGPSVMDVVAVGSNNFKGFVGTGSQIQQADGSIEILHGYKNGSDIVPHLHWIPATNGAGNIKMSLGYRWWNHGEVMPAETVISFTVSAGGVAYQDHRTDFGVLSGTGKTMGGRFVFRIFRDPADAADTYTGHLIALDFGIHYEKDTVGSRQIAVK